MIHTAKVNGITMRSRTAGSNFQGYRCRILPSVLKVLGYSKTEYKVQHPIGSFRSVHWLERLVQLIGLDRGFTVILS